MSDDKRKSKDKRKITHCALYYKKKKETKNRLFS